MKGPRGPSPQPSRSETHTLSVLPGSSPRFSACEPHHEKQAQEGQEEINPQVGGAPPSVRTQTPAVSRRGHAREKSGRGPGSTEIWKGQARRLLRWRPLQAQGQAEGLSGTPSLALAACDKGPSCRSDRTSLLPLYLPLTVCHPVTGGASPPTVQPFISRCPDRATRRSQGLDFLQLA